MNNVPLRAVNKLRTNLSLLYLPKSFPLEAYIERKFLKNFEEFALDY